MLAGANNVVAQTGAPPAEPIDPRLKAVEEARGNPFTDGQRKVAQDQIRYFDDAWEDAEQSPVPDGTEPAFVFTPHAPSPAKRKAPPAPKKGSRRGR